MIRKKPALGLDLRVETGFPPSRSLLLRRAKEGPKRSCSTKILERVQEKWKPVFRPDAR